MDPLGHPSQTALIRSFDSHRGLVLSEGKKYTFFGFYNPTHSIGFAGKITGG
jgi:hypothetical protein